MLRTLRLILITGLFACHSTLINAAEQAPTEQDPQTVQTPYENPARNHCW